MILTWTPCDRPVWTDAVSATIRHQHPLHARAEKATGKRVRFFALMRGNQQVGAAQIGLRHWPLWGDFAVLGRGPVWSEDLTTDTRAAALEALLTRLKRDHRGVMAAPDPIDDRDPLEGGRWLPVVTATRVAELLLDAPLPALRARMSGKFRNRLCRAEEAGLVVRHGPMPSEADHWLFATEAAQRKARGYRGAGLDYTLAWIRAGGRKNAQLFTAEQDGVTVAAMLFLLHAPGASYHIGWCNDEGRTAGAHPLLLWKAMGWLAAKGYEAIDMDVIDTETSPGLARFKLGAGARVVTLGATRLWAPGTGLAARLTRQAA